MRRAVVLLAAACGRVGFDTGGDATTPAGDRDSCDLALVAPDRSPNTSSRTVFGATGGIPPYAFALVRGGGSIDASSGAYDASGVAERVTISATDQNACTVQLDVEIGGDVLYLIGGDVVGVATAEVLRSTDSGATWSVVGQLPTVRTNGVSLVFDDRLWFLGGANLGQGFSEIWSSSDGATWSLEGSAPAQVVDSTITRYRDAFYWVGANSVFRSTDVITWTPIGTLPFRHASGLVVLDDKLYLIGGHDGGSTFYDDVLVTTDGTNWAMIGQITGAREYMGAAALGDQLIIAGGYDGVGYRDDVQTSPDGVTWTMRPNLPSARSLAMLVPYRGQLLYVGSSTEVWATSDGITWTTIGALPDGRTAGAFASYSPP